MSENTIPKTTPKTTRPYVRHKWIAAGPNGCNAYCWVCGISEKVFEKRIENAPMIEWDCYAVGLLRFSIRKKNKKSIDNP